MTLFDGPQEEKASDAEECVARIQRALSSERVREALREYLESNAKEEVVHRSDMFDLQTLYVECRLEGLRTEALELFELSMITHGLFSASTSTLYRQSWDKDVQSNAARN